MSVNQLKFKSLDYSDSKQLMNVSRSEKALGGSSGANSELAAWDEKARAYYNSVMSGETERPSEGQWKEFLNEMQWTEGKLWGSRGSEGENSDPRPVGDETQDLPIPEGAVKGALNNNVVWGKAKANIDFNGDSRTQDILSKDVTLNISSLSATVYTEKTRDTRLQPPTDVLKIIVQDQFTGQLSVYFVHDYKDAHITINTPTGTINQDTTGGLVTVGTYNPESVSEEDSFQRTPFNKAKSNASTRIWDQDDTVQYVATEGKETDRIYADTVNIVMPDRSHQAYVTKTGDHSYSIQIRDENGKVVRRISTEQTAHLNIDRSYAGNVFFRDYSHMGQNHMDGQMMLNPNGNSDDGFRAWDNPDHAADVQLTVGGKADSSTTTGSDTTNPTDTSKDTQLPADKKTGDTWHYDGNDLEDVDVTPTFDHKDNIVEIPGTFTLTPTDDQTVTVEKDPSTKHYIITVSAPGKTPVTYDVDPSLTKIDLKIQESKVKFIKHDGNGKEIPDDALLFDGKIQIKGKPISESNKAQGSLQHTLVGIDEIKKNIKVSGFSYDHFDQNWKADVDWASQAAKDIAAGLEDGNWDALNHDFAALGIGQDNMNCAFRAQMLMGFLRSAFAGPSRDKKIKMVLAQVFSANKDPDLRGMWTDALAKSGNTLTPVKSDFSGDWTLDPKDDTYESTIKFVNSINTDTTTG